MAQRNQHRRSGASPGGRRQQGATLIFTAFFLVVLVATIGLVIEVGRLYAAQSELQKVVNLAAIDSAREIGACTESEPVNPQSAAEAAVANTVSNQFDNGESPITGQQVQLGLQEQENGLLTFQPSGAVEADSSKVTLSRPPPSTLVSLFSSGGQMTATAAATSRPVGTITAGSTLVDLGGVTGANGLLSALLGGPVSLDVASYKGLAQADITLADLIEAQAGVATPEELLETNLSLPGALNLLANALDATVDGVDDVAAGTLDTLAGVADPNRTVLLGDALNIESGLENTVDALPVNAASLLTSIAQAANTGSPVSLPVNIDLGGLAKATGTVNIIQPKQTAFGRAGTDAAGDWRTVARTSQVNIQLHLEVLGALPDVMGGAVLNLPVFIKTASAEARLEDIICAGPSKPFQPRYEHTVKVGSDTALATIGVGEFQDITAIDPEPAEEVTLINAVGIAQVLTDSLSVNLTTAGCASAGTADLTFDGPFPPQSGVQPQTQRVGTPLVDSISCGLNELTDELSTPGTLEINVLGECIPILCEITNTLLGPVLGAVVDLLTPVLNLLDDILITPLLRLLGLSVGPADVSVESIRVNQPRVFCTGENCESTQT